MTIPIIILCIFLILGIKIIFTIKESLQINSTPPQNKEKENNVSANPQIITNISEQNNTPSLEQTISYTSEENNVSKQEQIVSNEPEQNNTPSLEQTTTLENHLEITTEQPQSCPKKKTTRKKTSSPKEVQGKKEKKNSKLCEQILSSIIMMHYEEAFTLLSKVENPSSAVCMSIGRLYYKGEGVSQDSHKAIEWFEKAVSLEDVNAEMELGDLYYFKNKFIEQDYEKAFVLYEKAAQKNYAIAQSRLGEMYRDGKYVEQNLGKAIEWFEKAVQNGDTRAKYQLQQVKESQEKTNL